ncbi:MAG: NAD(+)--rifampin ADP-ribosyltransferase [Sphingobacteriales bacterium]|nr:MAG: NAD(+)--rifampin ADP-ribosyltransferase [Sphingobacteriales bacterium]
MEFNPANPIVKRCVMSMARQEAGHPEAANSLFRQAWLEAAHDFEKYLAAYYLARYEEDGAQRLHWFETALQWALKVNNDSVNSALPALYGHIADCYTVLGDADNAQRYHALALQSRKQPADKGPFYHGTRADLPAGALLTPGGNSNYKSGLTMNHIYFTAIVNGAGLAAALAQGEGTEKIYIVEPTGSFENDPNVTDKKFPGNPSRSYRSLEPLKIVGTVADWEKITPEVLQQWREKLAAIEGDIIN